ncbi:MAG: hypothetical protein ACRDXX_09795, partial [Stackebrandtia sp.]
MNDEFTTSTGKTFDTETGRLWYGGVVLLPSVADEYADMSYKVWMTRDTADDDFASRTTVTGTLSDVYEAYDGLRGDFQNILAQSATNLVATGGALKELAEETSEN